MQCGVCKEKPAKVHLTQIVGEKVQSLHLCPRCAKSKGAKATAKQKMWDLVFEPKTSPSPSLSSEPLYVGKVDLSLLMNPLVNQQWLNKYLCNVAFVKRSLRLST